MRVAVNGRTRELPEGATVADLIEALDLGARNVVVEHNSRPLERSTFKDVKLSPGDVVEIVRPVQGG